nr:hypothetical protein [uncultured Rhodopila sp.]
MTTPPTERQMDMLRQAHAPEGLAVAAGDPDRVVLSERGWLTGYALRGHDPAVLWRPTSAGLCVLLGVNGAP